MTPNEFDEDIYFVEISNSEINEIKNRARFEGACATFLIIFIVWQLINYFVN